MEKKKKKILKDYIENMSKIEATIGNLTKYNLHQLC